LHVIFLLWQDFKYEREMVSVPIHCKKKIRIAKINLSYFIDAIGYFSVGLL
jgi:hypothetical protein